MEIDRSNERADGESCYHMVELMLCPLTLHVHHEVGPVLVLIHTQTLYAGRFRTFRVVDASPPLLARRLNRGCNTGSV